MSKVKVVKDRKPGQISALLGIAVMKEDVAVAEDAIAEIGVSATLYRFEGTRYVQWVAVDTDGLDVILDVETACRNKARYSMARPVPLAQVQTEPTLVEGGGATRLIASSRGLPFQTRYPSEEEKSDHPEYRFAFQRDCERWLAAFLHSKRTQNLCFHREHSAVSTKRPVGDEAQI